MPTDSEFALAPGRDNLDGLTTLYALGQAQGLFTMWEAGDLRTNFHPYRARQRGGDGSLYRIGLPWLEVFLEALEPAERNLLRTTFCTGERAAVTVQCRDNSDVWHCYNGYLVWPEAYQDDRRERGVWFDNRLIIEDLEEIVMAYGEIYVSGGTVAQALTTTPAALTGFTTDGLSSGVTVSHTTDSIVIDTAGVYRCEFSAWAVAPDLGATFTFTFAVNGVTQTKSITKLIGSAEYQDLHLVELIALAATDTLTVYAASDNAGGENLILEDATLSVVRVM